MTLFDEFVQDFRGRKVLIMGLGLLGSSLGDARLFAEIGCPLRITDLKSAADLAPSINALKDIKADFIFGAHRAEDIHWAEVIVRNAAVPWHHPLLALARQNKKPIVMDVSLFVQYARGVFTIGITGTRGKTTTTQLIYELIRQLAPDRPCLLGGNIQDRSTLPFLKTLSHPSATLAVLELSSWQLQAFHACRLSPHFAVVTNLYPDHLNYYASLEEYYRDKQAIYLYQTAQDLVFFNRRVAEFQAWARQAPGQVAWYESAALPATLKPLLQGEHNRENLAAAWSVGTKLGFSPAAMVPVLAGFKPLPHRLAVVRVKNGLTFINDTTATTPIATQTALKTVTPPILIILGGSDKQLPLASMADTVNTKADQVVLLKGTGTDRLKPLLNPQLIIEEVDNLPAALSAAVAHARPGSTVLFSPGFTSFGLFQNEYDRGNQFIKLVAAL